MAHKKSTALAVPPRPQFYGGPDPITLNRLETLVANVTTLQRERLNRASDIDPRRDLNAEFGYPSDGLTTEELYDLIRSEPAAAIVNDIYPLECFKVLPHVYEDDDEETETDWELALEELVKGLNPEPSYLAGDRLTALHQFMLTADMLSGYGRYGIILIGTDDAQELNTPIIPKKGRKVTFLRAFPEHLARVTQFDMNRASPRYGWPIQYALTFSDPSEAIRTGISEPMKTEYVHWSRVIHIPDLWHTASPSPIFAVPRINPVMGPVLDIRKVRGSSAEMYYKGAFGGHHFGTHPQLGPDVSVNKDEMRDMYEEYINGLQRALWTTGMTVDSLSPQVVDPSPQISVQIDAISIKTRTPRRILVGSERGELASQDDRKGWNGRIQSRHTGHITPRLYAPLLDRLINIGALPQPEQYKIEWPDIAALSDSEKADVLLKRTQSYAAYAQGVEPVVPPLEYMTEFDDMPREKAQAILDAASASYEDNTSAPAPLLGLVGGVTAMLQMFDQFAAGAMSEETLKQLIMLFYKVDEETADSIIADGLPEPPPGSMLPPLPPMKTPQGSGPGFPSKPPTPKINVSESDIVQNWLISNGLTLNKFCATGVGGGINPHCKTGDKGGKAPSKSTAKGKATPSPSPAPSPSTPNVPAHDVSGPSHPAHRTGSSPEVKPWADPPAPSGKKGKAAKRPKGKRSQTKLGDQAEATAAALGFRNILPEGLRAHRPGEVKEKGSTIDLEYDHSGRAYECKMCKTTATEYRAKPKKEEIDGKLKYAKQNNLTAYTLIAVMDEKARQIHYYGSKQPGIVTKKLSNKDFDYFGTEKY